MLLRMLYDVINARRSTAPRHASPTDRVDPRAARLNPWLRWRPEYPARPAVLTVADLAECTCPDLCDRDHGND
jgi:hypothetical protein